MVFQDYALWPHLVARDNVAFAMRRRGVSKEEGRRVATSMLERVGLGPLAMRFPSELSGGEQQRVALARALVGDTGLVLCDEPLSNLDADLRERMRLEIAGLVRQAGATTIYITHDQSEAFALADLVGVLERGHLVQLATPEVIYLRPASPFVARFTGLAGELPVHLGRPAGAGLVETEPLCEHRRPIVASLGGGDSGQRSSGGPGLLTVRPAAVRLCTRGEEHHLTGVVADVAFRGRGYEHAIDIPGHGRLTSVFSDNRAGRGELVGLRLDPRGCHLFSAGPQAPGQAASASLEPAPAEPLPGLHRDLRHT
jgi:ABC-type Fe3+/spermidine/putrescine transport system ATPase subunit